MMWLIPFSKERAHVQCPFQERRCRRSVSEAPILQNETQNSKINLNNANTKTRKTRTEIYKTEKK